MHHHGSFVRMETRKTVITPCGSINGISHVPFGHASHIFVTLFLVAFPDIGCMRTMI